MRSTNVWSLHFILDPASATMASSRLAMPRFERYVGIDYSGAETLTSSLKGL
jgi:hypothetical protein